MNRKSLTIEDPYNLPRDMLINEYKNLCKLYNELKQSDDHQRQEIHVLRREVQTASNDRDFLSAELEVINVDHSKDIDEIKQKHRNELDEYKRHLSCYKESNESFEIERDSLQAEIEYLKTQQLHQQSNIAVPVENNQFEYVEKMAQIEEENDELAQVVKDLQIQLAEALKRNHHFENHIEDLKDRLLCAEENLQAKREELDEKNELYETTQERLTLLSGELNALRSESDTANKRGNSLFAEVDDQRQHMKAVLEAQKIHYMAMKKELEESKHEIRKLKRENGAMYKEIEVCTHLFMNAEQHHTEKLNERIGELLKENEMMNKKLVFIEQCLTDLTQQRDVKWLDPMIELCKKETNDLKDKLYRCSLQKVNIADTLRKSQEETARWRFEALKSRCIIAERESLLEDNNIEFNVINGIDRKVRKIDNENVTPNIGTGTEPLLSYKRKSLTKSTNKENSPVVNKVDVNVSMIDTNKKPMTISLECSSHNATSHVEENKGDQIKTNGIESKKDNNEVKPECASAKKISPKTIDSELKGLTKSKKTPMKTTNSSNLQLEGGILKAPTPNLKFHESKTVKFVDNGSIAQDVEKTPSVRRVEKLVNKPKTAIKKRIFIPSKKPTNISE